MGRRGYRWQGCERQDPYLAGHQVKLLEGLTMSLDGQRTTCWSLLSSSMFTRVPGTKQRESGLYGKHLILQAMPQARM